MQNKRKITTSALARDISGKLIGPDILFTGIFNTLGESKEGDIVIRHKIDSQGVSIAYEKGLCAIITKNPLDNAVQVAEDNGMPLIIVDKIEIANAFALKWAIQTFAPDSKRVVITGTNGKSTTSHMIYHILKHVGWNVYTNTDSKSEFNTLIDPMVAKQISEIVSGSKRSIKTESMESNTKLENSTNTDAINLDALVIEVSEVQGWLDDLMKDHAFLMTEAIDPDVVVITNVAMDHIGLVNSLDEVFYETSGAVKALKKGFAVLNSEDELVLKMKDFMAPSVAPFLSSYDSTKTADVKFSENIGGNKKRTGKNKKGIYYKDDLVIGLESLPFKSKHFIQNTLAAISACICLGISLDDIKSGVSSYKSLKRRFSIIHNNPLIIDDFAHNPDGIKATINSTSSSTKGKLWVVCSIRGSRGKEINQMNAQALAEALNNLKQVDYDLIITNSSDVVDHLNIVEDYEQNIFLDTLKEFEVNYIFQETLIDSLKQVMDLSAEEDTILLIGAQGMDPAADLMANVILK